MNGHLVLVRMDRDDFPLAMFESRMLALDFIMTLIDSPGVVIEEQVYEACDSVGHPVSDIVSIDIVTFNGGSPISSDMIWEA
jgi:hypothetical protein